MELFVTAVNYSRKALHLRYLTRFWIRLCVLFTITNTPSFSSSFLIAYRNVSKFSKVNVRSEWLHGCYEGLFTFPSNFEKNKWKTRFLVFFRASKNVLKAAFISPENTRKPLVSDVFRGNKNRPSKRNLPVVFCEEGILKNFIGKHPCRSLFFDKVANLHNNF